MAEEKKKETDWSQFSEPTEDWSQYSNPAESMPPGMATGQAEPQSIKKWALNQMLGLGVGGLKQAGTIATTPYRIYNDLASLVGLPTGPQASFLEPEGFAQQTGAQAAEALSYFLPVGLENKAAQTTAKILSKTYRPLMRGMPSLIRKPVTRAVGVAGNTAARGAIGMAGAEATAYANQEEAISPKYSFGIPAAVSAAQATLPPVFEFGKNLARKQWLRGVSPGLTANKALARKIVDPALESSLWWASKRGMTKAGQDIIDEAAAAKTKARATMGQNPLMPYEPVEQELSAARTKNFESGMDAFGNPMANNPAEARALAEYNNYIADYVNRKVATQQATGNRFVLFDELEKTKQAAQDYAREHGKSFLNMAQPPAQAAEAQAQRVASNVMRPALEAYAPLEWANANKRMSMGIGMKQLSQAGEEAQTGQFQQLAFEPFFGFGAKLNANPAQEAPNMLIRAIRAIRRSPLYNTALANLNWKAATGHGYGLTQGLNYGNQLADAILSGAVTTTPEGQPVDIKAQTAQPANQPVTGEIPTTIFTGRQGTYALPADILQQMQPGMAYRMNDGSEWIIDESGQPQRIK